LIARLSVKMTLISAAATPTNGNVKAVWLPLPGTVTVDAEDETVAPGA